MYYRKGFKIGKNHPKSTTTKKCFPRNRKQKLEGSELLSNEQRNTGKDSAYIIPLSFYIGGPWKTSAGRILLKFGQGVERDHGCL